MAMHSSILAWESPWAEAPGGLHSMGSQRVRYDWVTNTFTKHVQQSSPNSILHCHLIPFAMYHQNDYVVMKYLPQGP